MRKEDRSLPTSAVQVILQHKHFPVVFSALNPGLKTHGGIMAIFFKKDLYGLLLLRYQRCWAVLIGLGTTWVERFIYINYFGKVLIWQAMNRLPVEVLEVPVNPQIRDVMHCLATVPLLRAYANTSGM